jgi:hypothetical protein
VAAAAEEKIRAGDKAATLMTDEESSDRYDKLTLYRK